MTAVPDAFTEFFLLGITRDGGSEIQWAGMTEDITGLDFGDKDIEGIALANGGRVVKRTPMGDESVTLKIYPVNAEIDAEGAVQFFHPTDPSGAVAVSSQPMFIKNTNYRLKHKLVFLWCTVLPAAASTVPNLGEPAYRIQIINAYMTSYKPSFDDKIFSAEVTFKWAPFSKAAVENKVEESTDGSVVLPAATTSSTAWA